MPEDNKKFHTHDCKGCVYLGSKAEKEKDFDFYFCNQGGNIPTVIARYSSYGPDYMSGLGSSIPQLKYAETLARDKGLIKG